uniref:Uncharacterized protein n=1 Tax=Leersia perrieri TaxID=77586 RepID=A0A0D9VAV4_9ORYZ
MSLASVLSTDQAGDRTPSLLKYSPEVMTYVLPFSLTTDLGSGSIVGLAERGYYSVQGNSLAKDARDTSQT